MKNLVNKNISMVLVLSLCLGLVNCNAVKNANNKQKGGAVGASGGAVLGAIIGNNIGKGGNGKLGAILGGVIGGTAGVLIGSKMDKQAQEIENEIPGAQVERVEDAIVITFDENSGVYFDTAKYNINSASKETLDKLAGIFLEYQDTNILVVGHTDDVGTDTSNMVLSENRANAVGNYLMEDGISRGRLTIEWFGENKPMHDNSTAEGRAKNRRVNIAVVPNEKMKKDAKIESGEN